MALGVPSVNGVGQVVHSGWASWSGPWPQVVQRVKPWSSRWKQFMQWASTRAFGVVPSSLGLGVGVWNWAMASGWAFGVGHGLEWAFGVEPFGTSEGGRFMEFCHEPRGAVVWDILGHGLGVNVSVGHGTRGGDRLGVGLRVGVPKKWATGLGLGVGVWSGP